MWSHVDGKHRYVSKSGMFVMEFYTLAIGLWRWEFRVDKNLIRCGTAKSLQRAIESCKIEGLP